MRPLFFRISFLAASNHRFLKNSHFLAFSTVSNFTNRRYEDEGRVVRVSVWWDFENCGLPLNTNAFRVAQSITNAVRSSGIKGPIQITAFGDVMQISRTNQEALSATGINLCHVPSGGKNSADRSLLVDLMYWVSQNPPPAHIFLISGDRDFAGILHKLRMNNYNILLASTETAPSVLCSAATIMWPWSSLLRGGNLSGKLFNQPPDGPYNSWYGQFKAPIEDPFAIMGQTSCISADESSELAVDTKVRPIPKVVVNHIWRILNSYPEGIDISLLRTELSQSNLVIDRDLYGYKKFSRFLSAMPNILKILPASSGQFIVRGVNTKFPDESVSTTYIGPPNSSGESPDGNFLQPNGDMSSGEDIAEGSTAHISSKAKAKQSTNFLEGERQHESSSLVNAQGLKLKASAKNFHEIKKEEKLKVSSDNIAEGSTVHSPSETKVKAQSINLHEGEKRHQSSSLVNTHKIKAKASAKNFEDLKKEEKLKESSEQKNLQEKGEQDRNLQEKPQQAKMTSPVMEIKDSSEKDNNRVLGPDELCPPSESGIFRRLWMKWFASRGKYSMEKKLKEHEDTNSGRDTVKEEALTSFRSSESVSPALFSPSSHEALIEGKVPRNNDAVADNCGQGSSLADQTIGWFKFSNSQEYDNEDKRDENNDQMKRNLKHLELFSKASFWFELELFLGTSRGAAVISQSQTREHLAENLQKQGPSVIQSLSNADLLHLVDLLISEKKWVEECHSQTFPFRLATPAGKEPNKIPPFRSNGLSHIFSDRQLNVQEPGERKIQNPPYAGVQQNVIHRGSSSKPKAEMLVDCQNLIEQILKEHPEGINMGTFRKLFVDRHGYSLDLKKLGYERLINLLHIMPGVRVEYNMILPAGDCKGLNVDLPIQENKDNSVNNLQCESLALPTEDDDDDSPWDELGPVDDLDPGKPETDERLTMKCQKGTTEQKCPDYEPLNEDESSDSEEEEKSSQLETDAKAKMDAQSSSLLQILDSWYSDSKGNDGKDGKSMVESSSPSSAHSNIGMKTDPPAVNPVRRPKLSKTYSFVTEQPVDNTEKLVDGILGSLKRSSEKSSDSRLVG